MPDIYRQSQMFREALIRRERRAAAELASSYTRVWASIKKELDLLTARIATESTAGLIIREQQLRFLLARVETQVTKFTAIAVKKITATQKLEVEHGATDALNLIKRAYSNAPPGLSISFMRLPEGVIEALVGNLGDGTPLRELLDTFGHELGREINNLLVNSIAEGRSVQRIAREMKRISQQPLARTLLISRTEVLRAYRQGSIATYSANKDVVKGWTWLSAQSARTCISCWLMHGTVHSVDEDFSDHPNGRCTAVPLTKSWADLGFEGMPEQPALPSGESLFTRLPAEQQRRIMGDASYRAWRAGAVDLQDFVGVRNDPRWGQTHYHRSLTEILGEGARRYIVPAPPQRRAA
jgi:SPP1 gp7 family putative phage head morphogenesis protein